MFPSPNLFQVGFVQFPDLQVALCGDVDEHGLKGVSGYISNGSTPVQSIDPNITSNVFGVRLYSSSPTSSTHAYMLHVRPLNEPITIYLREENGKTTFIPRFPFVNCGKVGTVTNVLVDILARQVTITGLYKQSLDAHPENLKSTFAIGQDFIQQVTDCVNKKK